MAECTQSSLDSAAVPRQSGERSSTTPLPSCVVKKGIPVLSINAFMAAFIVRLFAPAPNRIRGCSAFSILATAASIASLAATGIW